MGQIWQGPFFSRLPSETGSPYVAEAEAGLKLLILLPQTPNCWDYRYTLPCLGSSAFAWFLIGPFMPVDLACFVFFFFFLALLSPAMAGTGDTHFLGNWQRRKTSRMASLEGKQSR
jgi:hypothetical protein